MKTFRHAHVVDKGLYLGLLCLALASAPASARDDRLVLKLSGFHTDSRILLGASGQIQPESLPLSFAFGGQGRLRGYDVRPHVQAMWRFSPRQRLLAAHYGVDQGRSYRFDETIQDTTPGNGPLRVFGGSEVDFEFELVNLMYEYAVIDTERWTVGLAGGVHWARLDAAASVAVTAQHDGETRSEAASYDWSRRRWAPSFGLRAAYHPGERWQLSFDAQGFTTRWGNFITEDGHYERMGLNAEYRLTRNLGIHAGYDWFRLKLADNFHGSLLGGEVRYRGRARGELRVRGPTLGLTLAF